MPPFPAPSFLPAPEFETGRYRLLGIPEGVEGVRVTLEHMRRLVRQYRTAPPIRELALQLTAAAPNHGDGWAQEVDALFSFVRDHIRYVQDVQDVETLQSPLDTLELGAGDCDDKSILLAALLAATGHPSRFVAVGFSPDAFEHVFVETKIGRDWIALETTKNVDMGWCPDGIVTSMVRHV